MRYHFDSTPLSPETVRLEEVRVRARIARRRNRVVRAASPPPSYALDDDDDAPMRSRRGWHRHRPRLRTTAAAQAFVSTYLSGGAATEALPDARSPRGRALLAQPGSASPSLSPKKLSSSHRGASAKAVLPAMNLRELATMSAGGALLPDLDLWSRRPERGGLGARQLSAALSPSRLDALNAAVRTLPVRFLPAAMRVDVRDDGVLELGSGADAVTRTERRVQLRLREAKAALHDDSVRRLERSRQDTPAAEARCLAEGDDIEAEYFGDGAWYSGTITAVHAPTRGETRATYDVLYDDGDVEEGVAERCVRALKGGAPAPEPAVPTVAPAIAARTQRVVAEYRSAVVQWRTRYKGRKRRVLRVDAIRTARELHWWAVRRRTVETITSAWLAWRRYMGVRAATRREARPVMLRLVVRFAGTDERSKALCVGFYTWKQAGRRAAKAERVKKEVLSKMMRAVLPTGRAFRQWRSAHVMEVWVNAEQAARDAAYFSAVVAHDVTLFATICGIQTRAHQASACAVAGAAVAEVAACAAARAALCAHTDHVVRTVAREARSTARDSNRAARQWVYRAVVARRAVDAAARAALASAAAHGCMASSVAHDAAYSAELDARAGIKFAAQEGGAQAARGASNDAAAWAAHACSDYACSNLSAMLVAARSAATIAAVASAGVAARTAKIMARKAVRSLWNNASTARRNYSKNALRAADVAIAAARSGARSTQRMLGPMYKAVRTAEHSVGIRAALLNCAHHPATQANANLHEIAELVTAMLKDDASARYEWRLIDLNNDLDVSEQEFLCWIHDRFSHLHALPMLALKFAYRFTLTAEKCVQHGDVGGFETLYLRTQDTINAQPDAPSRMPRKLFKLLLRNLVHFTGLWIAFSDFTERSFQEIKSKKKRKAARLLGASFTHDDFCAYLTFVVEEAQRTGHIADLGRSQLLRTNSRAALAAEENAHVSAAVQKKRRAKVERARKRAAKVLFDSMHIPKIMDDEFARLDTLHTDGKIEFAEFANWFDAAFPALHTLLGMHRCGVEKIRGWNLLHIHTTIMTRPRGHLEKRLSTDFVDDKGRRRSIYLADESRNHDDRRTSFIARRIAAHLDRTLLIDLVGEPAHDDAGEAHPAFGHDRVKRMVRGPPEIGDLQAIAEHHEAECEEAHAAHRDGLHPDADGVHPHIDAMLTDKGKQVNISKAVLTMMVLETVFVPKIRKYLKRRARAAKALQLNLRARTKRSAKGITLPLSTAVKQGNVIKVLRMLRSATPRGLGELLGERDKSGATPMIHAAWEGKTDIVYAIIHAGADVNAQTWHHRNTPLHFACERGNREVCQILLDAGATQGLENAEGNVANVNMTLGKR